MDEFLGIQYARAQLFDDFGGTIEEFNDDMTRELTSKDPESWSEMMKRPKLLTTILARAFLTALPVVAVILLAGFSKFPAVSVMLSALIFALLLFLSVQVEIDREWMERDQFQQLREAAQSFGQRYPQLEALRAQYEQSNSKTEKLAASNNFQKVLEELSEAERGARIS